jgi:hypothetical protein
MYRSAAAIALASKPNINRWANQAIPGADNLTKAAPSDSDYRRGGASHAGKRAIGAGNQMVNFTVNESPSGSDGIDIALPFGSFMMMPFGERASFGVALLTLIALNVVEP